MFDDEKSVHILQKTCNQDKESCKHVGRYFKLESVTCPPPWKMTKSSRHKKKNTPEDTEEQKICKESDGKCFLKTLLMY